ncbi:hypothetical protein C8R48DRAFT_762159 [Suillus tomentosus]|nr:hypothetical protein C8R48DRAFT_762159 [Suillus tomentosus]
MRFTLLASLAVLCGIAFAAPYNAGSGRLVDDAVNNAGSVCQVACALAAGDLSGALQDAGNINDVENAIAGVISLIGSMTFPPAHSSPLKVFQASNLLVFLSEMLSYRGWYDISSSSQFAAEGFPDAQDHVLTPRKISISNDIDNSDL